MDDLVRWLGEQYDEDERAARAATPGPWVQAEGTGPLGHRVGTADESDWVAWTGEIAEGRSEADATFIAAHDPARVLREIDAKRRLLAPHKPGLNPGMDSDDNDPSTWLPVCSTCQTTIAHPGDWPCESVRLLVLPYADRAGYREAWRP